jgi:DNA-binding XRE family transcriptional regulator
LKGEAERLSQALLAEATSLPLKPYPSADVQIDQTGVVNQLHLRAIGHICPRGYAALVNLEPMDWNRVVGANLRRIRLERGLTQEDLAGDADMAMRHIGRIERGDSSPSVTMLARLADALAVTPDIFFKQSEP